MQQVDHGLIYQFRDAPIVLQITSSNNFASCCVSSVALCCTVWIFKLQIGWGRIFLSLSVWCQTQSQLCLWPSVGTGRETIRQKSLVNWSRLCWVPKYLAFHGTALQGPSAGLVSNVSQRRWENSETAGNKSWWDVNGEDGRASGDTVGDRGIHTQELCCIEKSLHLVMFALLLSMINPSLQRSLISLWTGQLSAVSLYGPSISCL